MKSKDERLLVAFDIDGTLIDDLDNPRYEVIDLLRWFVKNGHEVVVWSGGGEDYAMHWCNKLGLARMGITYVEKNGFKKRDDGFKLDIAVDDEDASGLGAKVVIKV